MTDSERITILGAACRAAVQFLEQTVPDGKHVVPLSERLAGLGGAYVLRQLREALAQAGIRLERKSP